jgi:type I restriction enzyme S subunit
MNNEREFKDLPEGWKWVRLEEVIENTYPGEWGDNPIDNENIFPVFSTLAIDYDGRIDFTKAIPRKLNKKKIEKLKLKKGMILIEKSGGSTDTPAGKVAILKQDFEGTCSNFIQILKPNNNTCNSYYLFYRLLYNFKNNLIEKYQQRTTGIINFILKDYFNEYIPLPQLPEQQKIAEILETVDNAIEKTDKIIEKYKRIKQGLMQDLLTKGIDENGNIRNEKTHKFKDSPLGKIPEEWEVGYVSNFTEINPITKINPKELYPFIEMDATPIMGKQYKYITLRRGIEAGSKFKKGDILLARITPSAENGKALLVPDNIEIGIGSTEFIVFRAKENIDNNFLFYLLISDYVRSIAIGLMEGTSGRQRIPKYVFEKVIKVAIPKSKSEQQRIAEILTQIDQTIEKEEHYKEKLKRIKQGLMEDLLTGKLQVNNLIKEA